MKNRFTGPKPEKMKTLFVTGKNFGGGIVFGYVWGKWWIWDCPPYLKMVIGQSTPVEDVGKKLMSKGFKWEWA